MTRPAVSRHLRVLRQAGLVEAVPQGRELLYRVSKDSAALTEVREYIDRVGRSWDRALEKFTAFAENSSKSSPR